MSPKDRPLAWVHGEVKTPPFSREARLAAGYLLRLLQRGESIGMAHSRPMPSIGRRCHELRIVDRGTSWRIMYRTDPDAVLILGFPEENRQNAEGDHRIVQEQIEGLRQ